MPATVTTTQVQTDTVIQKLDVLESPRTRRRRETSSDRHHRHYDELRVTFEKTIKGHYRNGPATYEKVGVLLVLWQDDDMDLWAKEVGDLAAVFRGAFHFEVETYHIPTERAVTGSPNLLTAMIAQIAWGLCIMEDMALEMTKTASGFTLEPRRTTTAIFTCHSTMSCDADILVITDCCHAALAFGQVEVGKHRFEIITATGPQQDIDAPNGTKSFTKILCRALRELAHEPAGFTTSKLYRNVYHKADGSRKPFLFDQSIHDWGRITMQPLRTVSGVVRDDWRPSAQGDACLHLELRMRAKPKLKTMNDLARAMQFLPHVKEVTFRKMHAPRLEIEGFMKGVTQAMKVRPLITRLRKRLEEKKLAQARARTGLKTPPSAVSHPPLLYNWNGSRKDSQYPNDEGIIVAQEASATTSDVRSPTIEVHGPVAWPQPRVDEVIDSEPPGSACSEAANAIGLPCAPPTNGSIV
ncbi:hypothetical protein BST61_g8102 [Cercospora zeina]